MQVTAYWITNLSLNFLSFLFCTPLSHLSFPFSLEISKYWVSETFIHWSTILFWIELNWNRIWSTLRTLTFSYSAPSTVNSMWTSTWTWNMTVRVKQKHLILIPQHHWSPTTSHPPPPPHHPPPTHLYAFCHPCIWKFLKNWKEEGDNILHKHMVLRFKMQITSQHRGQQRLCTSQWTKIKTQLQPMWP